MIIPTNTDYTFMDGPDAGPYTEAFTVKYDNTTQKWAAIRPELNLSEYIPRDTCGNNNCSICHDNKENNNMAAVTLAEQKKLNDKRFEQKQKLERSNASYYNPTFEVTAVIRFLSAGDEPHANLFLSDGGTDGEGGGPKQVVVKASLKELEAIEMKVYEARKAIIAAKKDVVKRASDMYAF